MKNRKTLIALAEKHQKEWEEYQLKNQDDQQFTIPIINFLSAAKSRVQTLTLNPTSTNNIPASKPEPLKKVLGRTVVEETKKIVSQDEMQQEYDKLANAELSVELLNNIPEGVKSAVILKLAKENGINVSANTVIDASLITQIIEFNKQKKIKCLK